MIPAENEREASARRGHKWWVNAREGMREALRTLANGASA